MDEPQAALRNNRTRVRGYVLAGLTLSLSLPGYIFLILGLFSIVFNAIYAQHHRERLFFYDAIESLLFYLPFVGLLTYPIAFVVAAIASIMDVSRAMKICCWLILAGAVACSVIMTRLVMSGG